LRRAVPFGLPSQPENQPPNLEKDHREKIILRKITMKAPTSGDRHPLLFYRRTMSRIGQASLALAIVIAGAGAWSLLKPTEMLGLQSDTWLFAAAAVAFVLCIFAFVARYFAYIRAFDTYLGIVTPFLRFKVSYRRIKSVRPTLVQQLFPPDKLNWAQRSFLSAFTGKTALVMELKGFPLNPRLLKLFLPDAMFSPQSTGLVLVVPDWMKLSTELASFQSTWLASQKAQR
jgi:hypothetical protein